jgi:L-amino acid N-acyltransferase YncA
VSATEVRLAEAADFPAIAELTSHYIRTSAIHFGSEPVSADELAAVWSGHVELYPWLVAARAGTFAGYAKAGPWRTRAAYRWTTEVGLYVAPEFHGRGIGRALYRALLDLVARQGFRSAIGGITLPNPASVALHERLGFESVGVVRRAGFKSGAWHDVGFWRLDLGGGDGPPGPIRTPADAWSARPGRRGDQAGLGQPPR